VCHPWPTDAPIPWPAVVRNGAERGRQVVTGKPFLIKPLSAAEVASWRAVQDELLPRLWQHLSRRTEEAG